MSTIARTIPHAFVSCTFICPAKSFGLYVPTARITCFELSLGVTRLTYLQLAVDLKSDIPNFHKRSIGKDTLNGPSRKLTTIVLHFRGHHSASLRIKLAPPIDSSRAFGIKFI